MCIAVSSWKLEVELSDVTSKIESAPQRSEDQVEVRIQQRQFFVRRSSREVVKSVNNQISEMRTEGEVKFGKIDERFTAMEARLNRLENHENGANERSTNVSDVSLEMHDAPYERKAVAAGFHDHTTEEEVDMIPTSTIAEKGMSKERIKIKCPAKPITHALLQFEDSEERDKYIRSANMQH